MDPVNPNGQLFGSSQLDDNLRSLYSMTPPGGSTQMSTRIVPLTTSLPAPPPYYLHELVSSPLALTPDGGNPHLGSDHPDLRIEMPRDDLKSATGLQVEHSEGTESDQNGGLRMKEKNIVLEEKAEDYTQGEGRDDKSTLQTISQIHHLALEKTPIKWVKNGRITFDKSDHDRKLQKGTGTEHWMLNTSQSKQSGASISADDKKGRDQEAPDTSEPDLSRRISKGKRSAKAANTALKPQAKEVARKHLEGQVETEVRRNKSEGVVDEERSMGKSDRMRYAEALKASRQSIEVEDDDGVDHSGWARGNVKSIDRF